MLAGGLNADNVSQAIHISGAPAVDISLVWKKRGENQNLPSLPLYTAKLG